MGMCKIVSPISLALLFILDLTQGVWAWEELRRCESHIEAGMGIYSENESADFDPTDQTSNLKLTNSM